MEIDNFFIEQTKINDCLLIKSKIFTDKRGLFTEIIRESTLSMVLSKNIHFIQENFSISKQHVLRGLHSQQPLLMQAKLIKVVYGKILDIVVDIRPNSPTFKKHIKIYLNAKEHQSLYIPPGCLHGFLTLSKEAYIIYKCDKYYYPNKQIGVIYNDKELNIDWEIDNYKDLIISDQDLSLPTFNNLLIKYSDYFTSR